MASAVQKITLSPSRDIPFNKHVLSQSNIRRVEAGVSIEELAADIARRGCLLQSLNVRPVLNSDGAETGMFEVPAGGGRFKALELLVKQKRLLKTAPVPSVVRDPSTAILAEDDCSPRTSSARRCIRSTSSALSRRCARRALVRRGDCGCLLRRMLTERTVRASDKRVLFVGLAAYEQVGDVVMRDLFEQDDGGWLESPALLDSLVAESLKAEAEKVAAEGWKWIEVNVDFPFGHTHGLRALEGTPTDLSAAEQATIQALKAEYAKLEVEYEKADELPEEVDARLGEIETALAAFEDRPMSHDPAEIPRAGVFVSIDSDGRLSVDRGYVRPEDEPPASAEVQSEPDREGNMVVSGISAPSAVQRAIITIGNQAEDGRTRMIP
jgi:hypothetical protein